MQVQPEKKTRGGSHENNRRDPQLFIADHVGTLPYARFMRYTPDLQGLGQPRAAPPPSRGRDRLARIVPVPTQSGYRDRTGQVSRFSHLR